MLPTFQSCCMFGVLALCMLAPTGESRAQVADPPSPEVAARALEVMRDVRTRMEILAVLDSARISGVPDAPLVSRMLESLGGQADPEQVVRGMREVFVGMRSARSALGLSANPEEITAGGEAVRAGLTTQHLQRIKRASRTRPAVDVLLAAADLVRRGVPVVDAADAAAELADAGADGQAIRRLQAEVGQDVAAGTAPRIATLSRTRALAARLRLPAPSAAPTDRP